MSEPPAKRRRLDVFYAVKLMREMGPRKYPIFFGRQREPRQVVVDLDRHVMDISIQFIDDDDIEPTKKPENLNCSCPSDVDEGKRDLAHFYEYHTEMPGYYHLMSSHVLREYRDWFRERRFALLAGLFRNQCSALGRMAKSSLFEPRVFALVFGFDAPTPNPWCDDH